MKGGKGKYVKVELLDLIDGIYDAACDPVQWVPLAERIQNTIGGHSVNFALENTQNPSFSQIYTNGATQSDVIYYETNIIGKDNINQMLDVVDVNSAFLTQDIWNEFELHDCYPYEEFYENLGFAFFNASLFYRDSEKRGWLSVVRSVGDPLFTMEELHLMQLLTPHLRRAFLINMHLFETKNVQDICYDSLERLSAGVILLTSKGSYVHSNSKAEKYLRFSDNLKQNFRVKIPDCKANQALQKVISEVLYSDSHPSNYIISFREGGLQKAVICLPWKMNEQSYNWLGQQVGCILFFLSPSNVLTTPVEIQKLFNISKAESRVLLGAINGLSAKQLADNLSVSEATVRFHLKNLLKIFESHSQTEMVSKVFSLLNIRVG
ncbi:MULTISPECIES: helix-turn-helix transcriptional regulator [Vibrio]|uniref:helix-turn-helix transcriptional regulator n=1 Tax=Vibrio TaxID=662 RepID=UPI001CDB5891|nr:MULTISPECIES: helix-turn-helix transcriptional regulator [Vibrio]MCA2455815.1 helix-turn-helix transcriptional regulator [Vibrio alginolyticus]MCA2461113.1 helix-turn-helix transcriptional regulator [Vibrio alginolyticus]MDW2267492.1 helix-turn-helix transcriptional regulator [Vibrio sp. 1394]MDW2294716.1 helix-turn-helix transcriptional regulator [Vibrio sp. 1404]